jgi:hypothetical protein
MAMNLIVTELMLASIIFIGIIVTWPLVMTWPSQPLLIAWFVSIVAAAILPLLTYPFSRTLWIAFDLVWRPPMKEDFEERIPRVR